MKLLDWFYLVKLGVESFWHIVILHHEMELEEDENYQATLTCSCGLLRVID